MNALSALLPPLELMIAIALVAIALLAPQSGVQISLPKRADRPRTKRLRRNAARKPVLVTAAIARVRRSMSLRVQAKIQERMARDVGAAVVGRTSTVESDDTAEADAAAGAGVRVDSPADPGATVIDWPARLDESARDLTLERRLALVRTLDAIGAAWCVPLLEAAREQEGDPEILEAVLGALRANAFCSPTVDGGAVAGAEFPVRDDATSRQATA